MEPMSHELLKDLKASRDELYMVICKSLWIDRLADWPERRLEMLEHPKPYLISSLVTRIFKSVGFCLVFLTIGIAIGGYLWFRGNPVMLVPPPAVEQPIDKFLHALRHIESTGSDSAIHYKPPDGRETIRRGAYQIGPLYWTDGCKQLQKEYETLAHDRVLARCIVLAYFRRYEPEALTAEDWEALTRLHIGGPDWRLKIKATEAHWQKMKGAFYDLTDQTGTTGSSGD